MDCSVLTLNGKPLTAPEAQSTKGNRAILILGYYANSGDPVQTPQTVASELGPHCLLTEISTENTVKMETSNRNP